MTNLVSAPPAGSLALRDAARTYVPELWQALLDVESAIANAGKPHPRSHWPERDLLRLAALKDARTRNLSALRTARQEAWNAVTTALIDLFRSGVLSAFLVPADDTGDYLAIPPALWADLRIKSLAGSTLTGSRFRGRKVLVTPGRPAPASSAEAEMQPTRTEKQNDGTATTGDKYLNLDAMRWANLPRSLQAGSMATLRFYAAKADEYGCSWHAREAIAKSVGYTPRSIYNFNKELRARGLIRALARTRNGARTSDVVQISGWPKRVRIPDTGHPKLGPRVTDAAFLVSAASGISSVNNRQDFPAGEENLAGRKYSKEIKEDSPAIDPWLKICLDALGGWGTERNLAALISDASTMRSMLAEGCDLARHIVPAIRAVVARSADVPLIETWKYFHSEIRQQLISASVTKLD